MKCMKKRTQNILKGIGVTALGTAGAYIFGNAVYTGIENIQNYELVKQFIEFPQTAYNISEGMRIGAGALGTLASASLPIYWVKSKFSKKDKQRKLERELINKDE